MPGGIYKSASTLVFPNNKVKMDKGYTGTNFNKALLLFLSLVPTSLSTLVFSPPQFKIQSLQVSHVSSTSIHRYLFFFFFPAPSLPTSPVSHPSLSGPSRGFACLPASRHAHQRDVGQQRVQTLGRIPRIILHHAVILRDAGKKWRKRNVRRRGERVRGEGDEREQRQKNREGGGRRE